jgi:hypothetical protein
MFSFFMVFINVFAGFAGCCTVQPFGISAQFQWLGWGCVLEKKKHCDAKKVSQTRRVSSLLKVKHGAGGR